MRKGLGKGSGKGYKNILGYDPRVHSDSRRGIKQPQKINFIKDNTKVLYYCPKCNEFSASKKCDFCGSLETEKSVRDDTPLTRMEQLAIQDKMMGGVLKKIRGK